ncbi:response regulator transcription factor [Halorhodospira neutriphila]|uniref:Two-component system response regulator n=1 Tax=Halorhodospira neutriphila TaxID=168379 RepID=A0ABS1E6J2_9GAMM|nr:response regulator transcription factor [Halorhodospira neutriphila]MBK1726844.1 two-component system response regulator [Halorhodospira neutriphila]
MLNGPSILIVDDDTTFSSVLGRSLSRRGCEVDSAEDPETAMQKARSAKPDYVVLDLKLGEHSGLNLVEPLNEALPEARILVLTGYASIPTAVEAIKLGAYNYLPKPTDAETVLATLEGKPTAEPEKPPQKPMSLRRLEWEQIQRVLNEHDGNISAAARALGIHRRTLQRKLSKKPVKQ